MQKKVKIINGFSILELMVAMLISSVLVGGLAYVVSEANFFLMIRRPPRSTLSSSSAASDVYKRQLYKLLPNS